MRVTQGRSSQVSNRSRSARQFGGSRSESARSSSKSLRNYIPLWTWSDEPWNIFRFFMLIDIEWRPSIRAECTAPLLHAGRNSSSEQGKLLANRSAHQLSLERRHLASLRCNFLRSTVGLPKQPQDGAHKRRQFAAETHVSVGSFPDLSIQVDRWWDVGRGWSHVNHGICLKAFVSFSRWLCSLSFDCVTSLRPRRTFSRTCKLQWDTTRRPIATSRRTCGRAPCCSGSIRSSSRWSGAIWRTSWPSIRTRTNNSDRSASTWSTLKSVALYLWLCTTRLAVEWSKVERALNQFKLST